MTKYYALAPISKYWRPQTDYVTEIIKIIEKRIENGDFVVVSEKALSTALNNIADESSIVPNLNAKLIARVWMQIGWGYFLGVICRFGPRLLRRLRNYPFAAGSRHKQFSLQWAGPFQALMFGSEGGVDGSNLPYSLVSLPLKNAERLAKEICDQVLLRLGQEVTVIIVDTDKTYSFRTFHFTPRPRPMRGIHSRGGVCTYAAGRFLKLRKRPTPLAFSNERLQVEEALKIANIADRARGPGSGATVWDMAAHFGVYASGVTWCMLETLPHKPVVIVRKDRP